VIAVGFYANFSNFPLLLYLNAKGLLFFVFFFISGQRLILRFNVLKQQSVFYWNF
jgi:hypothetical protein